MTFQGRSYFVLGGSGGIGSELVRLLAGSGARVLCAARSSDRLEALGKEDGVTSFALDATVSGEVEAAFQEAAEDFGGLDGAVNCVGSILLKPAHLTTDAEWQQTIALNLSTAFYLVRAAAKQLRKNGGSIVLVSTAAARIGLSNHEAIAAAKAGVIGLTLSAAASYAARGIRVNCVAPGLVETPLSEPITSREPACNASLAMHALGRLGQPGDVARALAWFLDPEQSWVSGQVLGVDGGLAGLRPR